MWLGPEQRETENVLTPDNGNVFGKTDSGFAELAAIARCTFYAAATAVFFVCLFVSDVQKIAGCATVTTPTLVAAPKFKDKKNAHFAD